jgi:uncharacterized protein YegP (UPF0339 family)
MKLLIYEDRAGGHRWRAVAANGRITGDSAEAYTRHEDAVRAAVAFKRDVADAAIVDLETLAQAIEQAASEEAG